MHRRSFLRFSAAVALGMSTTARRGRAAAPKFQVHAWKRDERNPVLPPGDSGGVDEKAKVWVNGKPIGISPGAPFYPFELDATEAVQPGKNVIAFCVVNDVVNELGTGGIVAPVMLYAPKDGKAAKLENLRPLGETFP